MGMIHKGGNAVPFHGDHHPVKVSTHRKSRNLFNQSYFNTEVNGITFSTDEDGTITVNGKQNTTRTYYYYRDLPAGTYTISVRFLNPLGSESNKHISVRVKNKDNKQYVQLVDTGIDYASAQVENEAYQQLKIGIVLVKSISYDNYKLQIQFEEGSEATEYEPYGLIEEPIFEPTDQVQDGKTLTFENTYNDTAEVTVFGESTQDGEPTPEAPVPIESIKSIELVSSNADGTKSDTRTIDLQGHELRSLPDGTHDELLVHRDGTVELVQRVLHIEMSVSSMNNLELYPGWIYQDSTLVDAFGGGVNDMFHMRSNVGVGVNNANRIGVNTISSINGGVLFFTSEFFGMRQTEFKEAHPDLVIEIDVKVEYEKTIQLPSINPLPTYHPYTFVDGNGADISAHVKVFE